MWPVSTNATRILDSFRQSSAFIEFDPEGKVLDANPVFLTLMGYTREEVVGRHHSMFVSEADRSSQEYREFWASLRAGRFVSGEFRRQNKKGEEVWILGSYNPVMQGSTLVRVVKIASDVTERRNMRVRGQSRLDAISRSQAMIEFDTNGIVMDANANFLEAMGYTLDEVKGKHHRTFMDPEEASKPEYNTFWADLRAGRFSVGEFRRLAKGGREIWLQASYNPLRDEAGQVTGVVKLAADITGAKKAQQAALRALEDELANKVQTVATCIAEAAGKAEDSARTAILAADNVNAMTTGADELSKSVSQINHDVTRALEVSNAAVEQAGRASETVSSLVIDSGKISSVVELISGITSQTNLLALNATIEAARAGEAGKGFAVVAGEVKALAAQTANATNEIKAHISAVQASTEHARLAIGEIATIIEQMNAISVSISAAVEEQAAVAEDMSGNMQHASAGVSGITTAMDEVARLAEAAREAVFSIVNKSAA